jgi:hypothetical protein
MAIIFKAGRFEHSSVYSLVTGDRAADNHAELEEDKPADPAPGTPVGPAGKAARIPSAAAARGETAANRLA